MQNAAAATAQTKFTTSPAWSGKTLAIRGQGLTVQEIARVAAGMPVRLTSQEPVLSRIRASSGFIRQAVEENRPIYGVTTLFGGMADHTVPGEIAAALQTNLIWSHKAGAGRRLPVEDVRASMLLRANSLVQGISGIRLEIIERIVALLNAEVTPCVCEFGSIGASGDLVPLAYIAGCITGLDSHYKVIFQGEETDAVSALERLGLQPLPLLAKEGLALINGTSVMSGIAANCVHKARNLQVLAMGAHALYLQALLATNQSFHPFIHAHKPHPGQIWAAEQMLGLLEGSGFIVNELTGHRQQHHGDLIQDRYSIRCLPQFLGPLADGIAQVARQVETESNSVTDNPLIDVDHGAVYHCGNFLGQYIGVAMDHLRYYLGLLAKHLDVQIAMLVSPEFNRGLAPSLVGNPKRPINLGLKALQLTANSIMPLLTYYGNSLADRFPTHAEQFNQNINSQGFGSANLARRSVETFEQYMAIALMFGVQAVDLRTHALHGHFDARRALSPATAALYEAVRRVAGHTISADHPFVWNDQEQFLDVYVARIADDIAAEGDILAALAPLAASVEQHSAV